MSYLVQICTYVGRYYMNRQGKLDLMLENIVVFVGSISNQRIVTIAHLLIRTIPKLQQRILDQIIGSSF